ncbi:MAG: SAM-dependent chlorinase/fluorinase [Planctomycetia bacterium]|nr:SAM-dependent chlorinase/fluorinase [Planctomycetia bacterium]
MPNRTPIITITTDFQVGNIYTPQMKGVIYTLAPSVKIVDITDAIPPQDVMSGAVALAEVVPFFPAGTIHIAVIDPGVGSARKLLYLELGDVENPQILLVPDNGLITILEKSYPIRRTFSLESAYTWRTSVSSTFHGRDILAPTAARLASETVQPEELGPTVNPKILSRLVIPTPKIRENKLLGVVLYADSFGNLVTNITYDLISSIPEVSSESSSETDFGNSSGSGFISISSLTSEKLRVPVVKTYADAEPGEVVALWGSGGRLEIAVVNGSAVRKLGFSVGMLWEVTFSGNRLSDF